MADDAVPGRRVVSGSVATTCPGPMPAIPQNRRKEMGGTGLSGLALSEGGDSFPGGGGRLFRQQSITRKIQAIGSPAALLVVPLQDPPVTAMDGNWSICPISS